MCHTLKLCRPFLHQSFVLYTSMILTNLAIDRNILKCSINPLIIFTPGDGISSIAGKFCSGRHEHHRMPLLVLTGINLNDDSRERRGNFKKRFLLSWFVWWLLHRSLSISVSSIKWPGFPRNYITHIPDFKKFLKFFFYKQEMLSKFPKRNLLVTMF